MVGALDMGGSSTQLIFHTGTKPGLPVTPQDFWSHSWLNFGVEKIRDRVVQHLVARNTPDSISSPPAVISNPCTFMGHEHVFSEQKNITLTGSGDSEECIEVIKRVVWPLEECVGQTPCHIDGIIHPPLSGHFYGMSVYFYAMDCIRQLGSTTLDSWPNPSINELEVAVSNFCRSEWSYVEENMLGGKHPYTRDDQVANRCLEGLYMTLLLERGFGFDGSTRNITLALEVIKFCIVPPVIVVPLIELDYRFDFLCPFR
jgi:GDA1/CD39 (nucleoside phosphatase) family